MSDKAKKKKQVNKIKKYFDFDPVEPPRFGPNTVYPSILVRRRTNCISLQSLNLFKVGRPTHFGTLQNARSEPLSWLSSGIWFSLLICSFSPSRPTSFKTLALSLRSVPRMPVFRRRHQRYRKEKLHTFQKHEVCRQSQLSSDPPGHIHSKRSALEWLRNTIYVNLAGLWPSVATVIVHLFTIVSQWLGPPGKLKNRTVAVSFAGRSVSVREVSARFGEEIEFGAGWAWKRCVRVRVTETKWIYCDR